MALAQTQITPPGTTPRPVLTELKLTPDRFRVRAKRGPHHKLSGGARISFMLSAATKVKLVVSAGGPGAGCVATVRGREVGGREAHACIPLSKALDWISVAGHVGHNRVEFVGALSKPDGHRIGSLRPGEYRMLAQAVGGSGAWTTFRII